MTTSTSGRSPSPWWFAIPLIGIYASAFFIITSLPGIAAPGIVAAAVTIDLIVVVPLLYYIVLVRGRKWPPVTVLPVFLLSFAAASFILPSDQQALLNAVGYALPIIEFAILN